MNLHLSGIECTSAQMEKLEQACEIHGLNLEEVLEKLNKNKVDEV